MPRRLLFLALCVAAFAPRATADPWVEVRTPHLSVVSDAGERRARELALQFEQMRAVFGSLLLRSRVTFPAPLRIVALRGAASVQGSLPLWQGPSAPTALYLPGEDRSYLVLDLSREPLPAGLRLYAQLLLDGNYPRTQPWFDAGFAEYFAAIRIELKEAQVGRLTPLATELQGGAWMPVTQLFAVRPGAAARSPLFQAESWLLVRHLFESGMQQQAAAYFDLALNQRLPVAEAIRRGFGKEPAELDRILRQAASPVRPTPRVFEVPAGVDDAGYEVTSLDQADELAALADLHLHCPGYAAQAIGEFQQALAISPHLPAAHLGLGSALLDKQQFAQASEHFSAAAAVEPSSARLHYLLALLAYRAGQAAGGRIEDPWTMKKEAETAISLAPEFAAAYYMLAEAAASEGDPGAAVSAMQKAVRLSPRNDAYVAHLAEYNLMAQKWDAAEGLYEYLAASDDPRIAADAQEDLQRLPALRRTPPPVVVRRERPQDWSQYDAPQWRRRTPAPAPAPTRADEETPTQPDTRPVKFLKGKLLQVDCSQTPAVVLTVTSKGATWKLRARDSRALVLVGADAFSCGWRDREVSVNFRESAPGQGDLMSLELD